MVPSHMSSQTRHILLNTLVSDGLGEHVCRHKVAFTGPQVDRLLTTSLGDPVTVHAMRSVEMSQGLVLTCSYVSQGRLVVFQK